MEFLTIKMHEASVRSNLSIILNIATMSLKSSCSNSF